MTSDVWIGLNARKDKGTYIWFDNEEVLYTAWAKGEPPNPATRFYWMSDEVV